MPVFLLRWPQDTPIPAHPRPAHASRAGAEGNKGKRQEAHSTGCTKPTRELSVQGRHMSHPSPWGCYLGQGGDLDQGSLAQLLRSLGGTPPACFPGTLPATVGWWLAAQPQVVPLRTGCAAPCRGPLTCIVRKAGSHIWVPCEHFGLCFCRQCLPPLPTSPLSLLSFCFLPLLFHFWCQGQSLCFLLPSHTPSLSLPEKIAGQYI